MLSCKAKVDEAVIFNGEPFTVVTVLHGYTILENYLGHSNTVANDYLLINGVKYITRRAEDMSLPF